MWPPIPTHHCASRRMLLPGPKTFPSLRSHSRCLSHCMIFTTAPCFCQGPLQHQRAPDWAPQPLKAPCSESFSHVFATEQPFPGSTSAWQVELLIMNISLLRTALLSLPVTIPASPGREINPIPKLNHSTVTACSMPANKLPQAKHPA